MISNINILLKIFASNIKSLEQRDWRLKINTKATLREVRDNKKENCYPRNDNDYCLHIIIS